MGDLYENIPKELKQLNQWCCFKIVERESKKTKLPVNANNGTMAKSNDPSTWTSFRTAVNAVSDFGCDGIGFMFANGYVGIDLDKVKEDLMEFYRGETEGNIVHEFVSSINSYAEISVSGTGIHVICKGELPQGQRRKGNIEMYDSNRFFVMTGKHIGNCYDVNYSQDQLVSLYNKYVKDNDFSRNQEQINGEFGNELSIESIINSAINSKNGKRFDLFMNGGWEQVYSSQSEADMAFANDLAFWTARDFEKMDTIFRQSSLYRDKYERKTGGSTYGEITLRKAINGCTNIFTPHCIGDDGYFFILEGTDTKEVKQRFYGWDDTGNAERFRDAHNGLLRYSFEAKKWFYYNGKFWTRDFAGVSERCVDKVIENMSKEKLFVPDSMQEDEAIEMFQKHIKRSRNANGRDNMVKVARKFNPVLYSDFDKDNNAINLKNGWFDLEKNTLNEHDKEKMFSKMAGIEYVEKARCEKWKSFMNEIFMGDKELIKFVQKALGYSITTSVSEQVIFILKGDGSNGKSVFLKIISHLLGDYAKNIQPEALTSSKFNNGSAVQQISTLENARFVTTQETDQGTFFNESLIK